MNIVEILPGGKNKYLNLGSNGDILLGANGMQERKIYSDITSFDGVCISEDKTELFATTDRGFLVNVSLLGDVIKSKTLMESKGTHREICSVRCLYIEGRYHLFYCIKSSDTYLVHQVFSDDGLFEPQIVDKISNRMAYNVIRDYSSDIHIVYSSANEIRCRKYVYSKKMLDSARVICYANPREIQPALYKERLFMAYTEQGAEGIAVNIVSMDSSVKKKVFSGIKEPQFCINASEYELAVHIIENGVCYEVKSDEFLNVSKPLPVGKSSGIRKVISPDGYICLDGYPVNRFMAPLEGFEKFKKDFLSNNKSFGLKGSQADDFAGRYKDIFEEKVRLMEEETVRQSLSKIEVSLNRLVDMVEKVFNNQQTNEKKDVSVDDSPCGEDVNTM